MNRTRIVCLAAALACVVSLSSGALALEVESGTEYCFTASDFGKEELTGICLTTLPDSGSGTVMLGTRVVRPGDILTASQLEKLRFLPLGREQDGSARICYLPIYENRVAPAAEMAISILGKENKAPVARDSAVETYKNLPNEGTLAVTDPEDGPMTYTLIRPPRRGDVVLREDGSFLYTPKKNKVGVDSFVYTAADKEGKVSREATVTVTILKPTDPAQYSDTVGKSCRFAAEWMKNTGIFVGEQIGGVRCFNPDAPVTRGEFLAMLTKVLDLPLEEEARYTGFTDEFPRWLQPYLAAALRSGITANWPEEKTFGAQQPVTGAQAALMVQNVLDLSVSSTQEDAAPAWAAAAMTAMKESGISLKADAALTRAQVAELLYQAGKLAETAPGMAVFH